MSVSTSGGGAIPVTLTPPDDCASASISPDDTQIAYFGQVENSTIFLANVDGYGEKVLVQIQHYEIEDLLLPALNVIWSPNGERLAIVSESAYLPGYGVLYLIDSDGNRGLEYVSSGPLDLVYPSLVSWSPDGEWLFFY